MHHKKALTLILVEIAWLIEGHYIFLNIPMWDTC